MHAHAGAIDAVQNPAIIHPGTPRDFRRADLLQRFRGRIVTPVFRKVRYLDLLNANANRNVDGESNQIFGFATRVDVYVKFEGRKRQRPRSIDNCRTTTVPSSSKPPGTVAIKGLLPL